MIRSQRENWPVKGARQLLVQRQETDMLVLGPEDNTVSLKTV